MTYTIGEHTTRTGLKAVVLTDSAPGFHPLIGYVILPVDGTDDAISFPLAWERTGARFMVRDRHDLIGPWIAPISQAEAEARGMV